MQIWISSDHHLGHDNMYKFTADDGLRIRREFETREQGEEYMLDMHNERVKSGDHWYCLGDIVMPKSKWALKKVQLFNGHRRLVLGNHDILPVQQYIAAGFQKVFGSRKIGGLVLSHIPIHPASIPHWCVGNVHGHIHRQASPEGKYFNACVEMIGYTPVPIEEIEEQLRKVEVKV